MSNNIRRYTEQRRKHAEVLGRFERDMEALSSVEIPPQARTPDLARLSDLVPGQRMRDWAAQCASSHQNLSDKVRDWTSAIPFRQSVQHCICLTSSVRLIRIRWLGFRIWRQKKDIVICKTGIHTESCSILHEAFGVLNGQTASLRAHGYITSPDLIFSSKG